MLRRVFDRIASIPFRHNRIVLVLVAAITAVSVVWIMSLEFEWDQSKAFPEHLPANKDYKKYSKIFGSSNNLFVTVETDGEEPVRLYGDFINKLSDAIAGSPLIRSKRDLISEGDTGILKNLILKNLFLYLTPEDRAQFTLRYTPEWLKRSLAHVKKRERGLLSTLFSLNPLYSILSPFALDKLQDPLGINALAIKYFRPSGLKFTKRSGDNYYVSKDGQLAFFVVEPVKPFWDFKSHQPLVDDVRDIIARSSEEYAKELSPKGDRRPGPSSLNNVRVSFAGYHTLWLENLAMQKRDMGVTTIVTIIGVFLIFLIGFGNIRYLHYAFVPLLVSLIWTLGLCSALFTSINIYTFVFAILIMGLGIDFAIHLLNGYRSALLAGKTTEDAWRTSLRTYGGAIVVGAATTITVFALLTISDFPGISQLGLLVAAGLLFVLINVIFCMPAIIRQGGVKGQAADAVMKTKDKSRLVRAVVRFGLAHAKKITVATIVLTVGFGLYIFPLTFSPEATEPVYKNTPSATVVERLVRKTGVHPEFMLALSIGRTVEEVLETSYRFYTDLQKLQKEDYIVYVDSPSRYLPPYDLQKQNLKVLRNTPVLHPKMFIKNYAAEINAQQIRSPYFRSEYPRMALNILSTRNMLTPDKFEHLGFSDELKRYLYKEGDRYELASYIYYSSKAYDRDLENRATNKLLQEPFVKEGKVKLVGAPIAALQTKGLLIQNIKLIFIYAAMSIFAISFLYFRSMKASLIALVPTAFGIVAMLAVFKLMGYELNAFNAIWLAIILGIGIDDGVHFISRYRASKGDPVGALGDVGRAITMTTLTTLVAFGSMMLAEFPGIRSSGVLAGIGMIFSLIASLVILPALMKLILKRKDV